MNDNAVSKVKHILLEAKVQEVQDDSDQLDSVVVETPFSTTRIDPEKYKNLKFTDDLDGISDGFHTFRELYRYRLLYNVAFLNELAKSGAVEMCKSLRHNDGEKVFGGDWFIVMVNLPTGQISNHYHISYWDLFKIPEKDKAFPWDGHTAEEAADRLEKYVRLVYTEVDFSEAFKSLKNGLCVTRRAWNLSDNFIKKIRISDGIRCPFIEMVDERKEYKLLPEDIMATDWIIGV